MKPGNAKALFMLLLAGTVSGFALGRANDFWLLVALPCAAFLAIAIFEADFK